MPKRLIATLVAAGSLMLATAPAEAQSSPQLDPTCNNGQEGTVNLRVDLGPLARATVRLLCVN
jgi:hypothetical protein